MGTYDRRQGDYGMPVGVGAKGLDLAGALVTLEVRKPSGALVFWPGYADLEKEQILHALAEGELDEAGTYVLTGESLKAGLREHTQDVHLRVGPTTHAPAVPGWTQLQLPNLRTYWGADAGVAVVSASKVPSIADRSPEGVRYPRQTGALAKMPTYGISPYNGKPGIIFTPTVESGPQVLTIPNMTYNAARQISVGFVASDTSTEVNQVIFEGGVGNGNIWAVYANSPNLNGWLEVRTHQLGQENGVRVAETLAAPRSIIFTIDRDVAGGVGTPEIRLWIDGVEQVGMTQTQTGNPAGAFDDLSINIGARNDGSALGWLGIMHEHEVSTGLWSASDIANLYARHKALWLD